MELKIDGVTVQLGDSKPSITKKSIDINNPTNRFIDFTNSFKLANTVATRKTLNSPQAVGSNNKSFDKFFNASLHDVFKIFSGKGFLTDASVSSMSFQIVDGAKELYQALNIKLKEILWDDKDTTLETTSIDALDTIDINNCWFWGKACYHVQGLQINTDQTTGNDRCKYSRPAFYVQGLLNRAITNAGYTLTSPLPDLAFSSNHDHFYFTSYQKTISETYVVAGTAAMTGFDTYDFKMSAVSVTNTTVGGLRKFYIRIRGHITTTAAMQMLIHCVDVTGNKVIDSVIILPSDGYIDFTSSEIYDGPTGMTVSMSLVGTGTVVFDDVIAYSNLDEKNIDLSANPYLGSKIKAYDHLPDMTYLDLLKLICVISFKYPVVDTFNKTVTFESLANLNKLNSVDWSDKFIQGSESISAEAQTLAQKNWLKYKNDLTVPNQLGFSSFETDNETLEAERDYINLNFSATKEVVLNSNEIAQVPIYDDTTRITDQTINIRLFYATGSLLQFKPIAWEQLVTSYYSNYFNSLYRVRAIDAYFNLNKMDILKWTPKQLVYIDFFKTTFMVLEINNFISGRKTKVKLLAYGR